MNNRATRDKALDAYRKPYTKLFQLGQILSTPGARAACAPDELMARLAGHVSGNWGCVCFKDWLANDQAVLTRGRILSAYPIDACEPCRGYGKNTIWIVTEADRKTTTLLLPSEAPSQISVLAATLFKALRRLGGLKVSTRHT